MCGVVIDDCNGWGEKFFLGVLVEKGCEFFDGKELEYSFLGVG